MSQTSALENAKVMSPEKFSNSLHSMHLAPLWTELARIVSPRPNPKATAAVWKYAEVRPLLMEAGQIIGAEKADTRALVLVNPDMDALHTTDTIYSGLQLILPNETAAAHRHIAFALRFIVEGANGFTAVEGQKMAMERGDVILTPSWHWHNQGNEGKIPMIWLDAVDLPLLKYAPVNFSEVYSEKQYPSTATESCQWRFPWKDVEASLKSKTGSHRIHHYYNNGKHLSKTLSAQAEMIEPGHATALSQETCSFIYHCYAGDGQSIVKSPNGKETTLDWVAKDTFVIPAWSRVQHINKGSSVAYLFAINDRPLIESLGLFRKSE